jgi:AcrR family transcriptional regulator
MSAQRTYGGLSAEERRAQRRSALLDAALEIIGTQGLDKLTVSGMCSEAGLNERYYYESFGSRDDVLTALIDGIAEELVVVIAGALQEAGENSRAKAHAAITAGIHLLTDDPRKTEVTMVAAMATPGAAGTDHRNHPGFRPAGGQRGDRVLRGHRSRAGSGDRFPGHLSGGRAGSDTDQLGPW